MFLTDFTPKTMIKMCRKDTLEIILQSILEPHRSFRYRKSTDDLSHSLTWSSTRAVRLCVHLRCRSSRSFAWRQKGVHRAVRWSSHRIPGSWPLLKEEKARKHGEDHAFLGKPISCRPPCSLPSPYSWQLMPLPRQVQIMFWLPCCLNQRCPSL